MGYYTNYEIDTVGPMSEKMKIDLGVVLSLEEFVSHFLSYGNPFDCDCKWYDHDVDMKDFSLRYPDDTFKLEGRGEEAGDWWVTYYRNGKMQYCPAKMTFEEFDESKLK